MKFVSENRPNENKPQRKINPFERIVGRLRVSYALKQV